MAKSASSPAVEVPSEVSAPVPTLDSEAAHRSMLDLMAEKFKNEKRVPVKCRNDGDIFLQVNGYTFLIQPNKKVEVPESIVPLLEDAGYI